MKSYYSLFLAAASLLLLPGCTKEPMGSGEGIPMRVAPSLDGCTRASLTSANLTEFYLQINCTDAAFGYFEKLTKSGTGWEAGKRLLWKNETTTVSYSAAFFGSHAFTESEFTSGVNLSIPANQSTQAGLNSADLLTLPAADIKYEDTAGGVLPVNLHHGLAKVKFVLTLGGAFYDANLGRTANPVTVFTVKGANTGFNFKPHTGVVTVTGGTQADITPLAGAYTPGTASSKAATATYEAILLPQSFAAGELRVSFSIGLGNYTWSNSSAITLSAGTTVNLPLSVTNVVAPDPYNGHAWVDLGAGLKWATCNVGAENPDDYGYYLAWGESAPKEDYSKKTYFDQDPNSIYLSFIKYTHSTKTVLDPEDDAATVNWGAPWRMPTIEELQWLIDNCTWERKTTAHGYAHGGALLTSKINGNSIFLPGAGVRTTTFEPSGLGEWGYYWSSNLSPEYQGSGLHLFYCYENESLSGLGTSFDVRTDGLSVRPVAN